MPPRIDMSQLINKEFGRLTVIGKGASGCVRARCTCGAVKDVHLKFLKRGTKSCGCLRRQMLSLGVHRTHGMSATRTYNIYLKMVSRSTNPADAHWEDYGGRGIGICERWKESFENFFADMGECPPRLTIERVNNDKGYSLNNCKWATQQEQNNNRRNNRRSLFEGEMVTQTEIALRTGRHKSTIYRRMRLGFTPEQIASPEKLTGRFPKPKGPRKPKEQTR